MSNSVKVVLLGMVWLLLGPWLVSYLWYVSPIDSKDWYVLPTYITSCAYCFALAWALDGVRKGRQ